jgi:hypothetical protein
MKKRLSRVLNFFAFNLLFFAIYLNFIHRDGNSQTVVSSGKKTQEIKGTVIVSNPDVYLQKNGEKTQPPLAQAGSPM